MRFTHFENGQAIMVNIGEKSLSHRVTKAVLFGTRFSVPLARKAMTLTHEFIPWHIRYLLHHLIPRLNAKHR